MVAFYNQADQDIYNSGSKFVPQERYRLGYTPPVQGGGQDASTPSFGIPNTNAFTNSGGDNFSSAGNAFGYGSQVEPVSYGSYGEPGYMGGLPGNVQQYGQGRQFVGDEEGLGPTTGTNSYNKKVPGLLRSAAAFVPFGNTLLNFAEKRMNKDGRGPSNNYGIAGLSEAQKGAYNNLAGEGMLFDGPGGVKTLTGKNFTGKGYMEGQMDLAKGFGFDTMTDEEIEDDLAAASKNKNKQFEYRQKLEASKMFKTDKIRQEKQRAASAENRGEANAITNRLANEYKAQQQRDGKDFSVSGPDTSSNPTGKSNQASSERGYAMHGADGGRAGYFFGGRVNFKDGGLASIL